MPDTLDKPADGGGFFSRWSQRKVQARVGAPLAEPVMPTTPPPAPQPAPSAVDTQPAAHVAAPATTAESPAAEKPAPPTLDDVAALTHESDYARFVARDVDAPVRNAALKKLFTDPHFNVMDGLDTYIDDYGIPDPLPEGMLRQMAQSQFLGLFRDEDKAREDAPDAGTLPALNDDIPPDEDPDLRLQPHDAAGRPGAEPGAGELAQRQL
ncbi:proline rich protein [Leptothrix cholodnii SP-6]|uniref:Proline rich protein n=1 Tax=Leptothrix cholodnii (strain ATCC 51168 / LMG 8142 / SP-6) TaxID=395495 RepID=B1Y5T9_LEPCP|nr:DUF3306 domain-containing protein [Leptothrix cholodnii]ACB35985.1 proline rich protein [Leptothrix cholodnii SP-6]